MLFSSFEFIIFFFFYFFIHLFLNINARVYLIIFGSLVFYSYWQPINVFVPIILSLLAWLGGLWVEKTSQFLNHKSRIAVLIILLLLPLIYFKYSAFILTSIFHFDGKFTNFPSEIPIGISFITFTAIAYIIEIYKGNFNAEKKFRDVFQYVLFFPQLIAGPILRPSQLINQLKFPKPANQGLFIIGILFFIIGIVKKVFFADQIGILIDPIWDAPLKASNEDIISAFYGFATQIYMDFSGYTDMAIGLALILGVNLPSNFDSPYLASNISEFWRRWHITLSNWLRDYVYIPFGGNRTSTINQKRNVILTMIIGGIWHGAGWNFLIWGAFHGVLLALSNFFREKIRLNYFPRPLGILITFHLVCVGWIFFRASSFDVAMIFLSRLIGIILNPLTLDYNNFELSAVILILLPLFMHHFDRRAFFIKIPEKISGVIIMPILIVLFLTSLILSYSYNPAFIYFDF